MSDRNEKGGLPSPLLRALAYERARSMAESIIATVPDSPLLQKYARDMETCGLFLLLRHYYETGQIRVRGSSSCKHRCCCPLCAVRMARKSAGEFSEKIKHLRPWRFQLVTITQPGHPDYCVAIDAMQETHKRFMQAWRDDRRRLTMASFFSHYVGGHYNIEVKEGGGSGLAHPHIHYLMHGRGMTTREWVSKGNSPESHPLSLELKRRNPMGGFICDVRDIEAETDEELILALMEVVKYVHDFKCKPADVWRLQQAVYGRRMSGSFGTLRGLKLTNDPDDILNDSEAQKFVEYVLRWENGAYSMDESCLASFEDLIND